MDRLSLQDASFLYLETPAMPMNIGSVQKFALPQGAGAAENFCKRLRTLLARRAPDVRFMSCKLKQTPFAFDHPVWVFDNNFSIDAHLKRFKLTGKGTQLQLERRIAQLHEKPLPRDKPLWIYYLFEGLHDGTVVLYEKYHHACFDGVTGQQVMELLFTEHPDDRLPLSAVSDNPLQHEEPKDSTLLFDAGNQLARQTLDGARALPSGLRAFGSWLRRTVAERASAARIAPRTMFNCALSPYRTWTCASIPLSEVKTLARHNQCSVNDLFLAICSGGVKRYLERNGQLPDESLLCGVPVSLHAPGDDSMKNSVSMLVSTLATDKQDPRNRIAAIKSSMRSGIRSVAETSALTPDDFHLPGIGGMVSLASTLTGAARWADVAPPIVNLVISNVPGPRTKRYLCGAEMLTHYPVSIPGEGLTLNITCQSYVDRLDIGFTACQEALPDIASLRRDTLEAWEELKALRQVELEDLEVALPAAPAKTYSLSGSMTA